MEKGSSRSGQAWFCTTGLPADIVVQVDDMIFHLHKFPLMAKSKKLNELITAQEQNTRRESAAEDDATANDEDCGEEIEEEEEVPPREVITLPDFPGGAEAFELATKFCYGVKLEVTSANVAALRCAAEYLSMSGHGGDDENNLAARADRFLALHALRNLPDAITVLKSCEKLAPFADELGLLDRCIDAIASRAVSAGSSAGDLFGWPAATSNRRKSTSSASWLDHLTDLSRDSFSRVIAAMKSHNVNPELIESALIAYAKRAIPGLSRSARRLVPPPSPAPESEQREVLESLIANLPFGKGVGSSHGAPAAKVLFGILRAAAILKISDEAKSELEFKISSRLAHATVDDLLIPSYSYLVETLYDVECVERIVKNFLEALGKTDGDHAETKRNSLVAVGRLIDAYLAEVASDVNLPPERFCDLALALPDDARVVDDGLYRAVDIYLKAHLGLTEEEKERICGVMDYQKLTLEACTHAAQNERLPLRAIVQVLFFEQLQLRQAIAQTILASEGQVGTEAEEEEAAAGEESCRRATRRVSGRGSQLLRFDMDSMRNRVHELERECSSMKKAIEKIDRRSDGGGNVESKHSSTVAKRIGCKFRTQVCDSQQHAAIMGTPKKTTG